MLFIAVVKKYLKNICLFPSIYNAQFVTLQGAHARVNNNNRDAYSATNFMEKQEHFFLLNTERI